MNIQSVEMDEDEAMASVEVVENAQNMSREVIAVPSFNMFSL